MKNINTFDYDEGLKEEVEYFLLDWAYHFRKNTLIGNLEEAVRLMITDSREEFETKFNDFVDTKNVFCLLEKLKRFGKRPLTSVEITSSLNENISERAVHKQLQRLKRWKQIEEIKTIVDGKPLILFKAV